MLTFIQNKIRKGGIRSNVFWLAFAVVLIAFFMAILVGFIFKVHGGELSKLITNLL